MHVLLLRHLEPISLVWDLIMVNKIFSNSTNGMLAKAWKAGKTNQYSQIVIYPI